MREGLITVVLIIWERIKENIQRKAYVSRLSGKPAPCTPMVHFPLLHQGKLPPSHSKEKEKERVWGEQFSVS